jgi:hypothetical protein
MSEKMEEGKSGLGRGGKILIYLAILGAVNLAAFLLDWGFWIY